MTRCGTGSVATRRSRRGRGAPTVKVDEASAAEAPGSRHAGPRANGVSREPASAIPLDVRAIRGHFEFPWLGRVVTNNEASTQPPAELLALYASLGPGYENVHRGQSGASQAMTGLFEESYDTIADFIGAPGRGVCRAVPEHDRGDQRGHVCAADRVR